MSTTILPLVAVLLLASGTIFGGKPEKGCGNNPADIVFVLDESGSIWGPHFIQQLDFVQKIIESFDVGFDKTHVGVVTFGSEVRTIFPLGKFTSEEELKAAVKSIKQQRGETYTNLALKSMREDMFSRQYSRPWVRHVAIIITDGESNLPQETKKEADLSHRDNIQIFAIGVGTAVVKQELEAIASSPGLVFTVSSYEALESLRQTLAWKACAPPPQMIEGCTDGHRQMDHVWALSDQANAAETKYALNFIKSVTGDMKIDSLHVQVGLAPRTCDPGKEIRLKDHDTKDGFWADLDKSRLTGLRTDRVLEYIRTRGLSDANGARSDAVKYGILVVDNKCENWEKTLREAVIAKNEGIRLIVIGVGENIRETQLKELVSSEKDYFFASNYGSLADLKSRLIQRICEGIVQINVKPKSLFELFYEE